MLCQQDPSPIFFCENACPQQKTTNHRRNESATGAKLGKQSVDKRWSPPYCATLWVDRAPAGFGRSPSTSQIGHKKRHCRSTFFATAWHPLALSHTFFYVSTCGHACSSSFVCGHKKGIRRQPFCAPSTLAAPKNRRAPSLIFLPLRPPPLGDLISRDADWTTRPLHIFFPNREMWSFCCLLLIFFIDKEKKRGSTEWATGARASSGSPLG